MINQYEADRMTSKIGELEEELRKERLKVNYLETFFLRVMSEIYDKNPSVQHKGVDTAQFITYMRGKMAEVKELVK